MTDHPMSWARFRYRDRNVGFVAALFHAHFQHRRKRRAF